MLALAIRDALLHIKRMRTVMTLVVVALMALLCASLYYAYGIWTTLGAADLPGWMYAAMIGGVLFSLLVGGIGTIAVALLWMKLFPELRRIDTIQGKPD